MSTDWFPVFDTAEDQFFIALLDYIHQDNWGLVQKVLERNTMDRDVLIQNYPLGVLYPELKKLQEKLPVPAVLYDDVAWFFKQNLFQNEHRIQLIRRIAALLDEHHIRVVFIKGAAEICDFYHDPYYLGLRIMGDVDLLCPPDKLDAVHKILVAAHHQLYRYDYPTSLPEETVRLNSLNRAGHLVYNFGTLEHLEVHPNVSFDENRLSFPPDFTEWIFQGCRSVSIAGTTVYLPCREDMMVYFLCHESSSKDNSRMTPKDSDGTMKAHQLEHYRHLTNRRFNTRNIHFLFKLSRLVQASGPTFQWNIVDSLLEKVENRALMAYYLSLAAMYLGDTFPIKSLVRTPGVLSAFRMEYVQSLMAAELSRAN